MGEIEGEERATGRVANTQPHQTAHPISERWMREAADSIQKIQQFIPSSSPNSSFSFASLFACLSFIFCLANSLFLIFPCLLCFTSCIFFILFMPAFLSHFISHFTFSPNLILFFSEPTFHFSPCLFYNQYKTPL